MKNKTVREQKKMVQYKRLELKKNLLELLDKIATYRDIRCMFYSKSMKAIVKYYGRNHPSEGNDLYSLYYIFKWNPQMFFKCMDFDTQLVYKSNNRYEELLAAFTTYMMFHPSDVKYTSILSGGVRCSKSVVKYTSILSGGVRCSKSVKNLNRVCIRK
jgi:hypothetical protein